MLTNKQKEVYDFICFFRKENGIPPTIREISLGTYTSDAYASVCLQALETEGYIKREKGKRRNIVVLRKVE